MSAAAAAVQCSVTSVVVVCETWLRLPRVLVASLTFDQTSPLTTPHSVYTHTHTPAAAAAAAIYMYFNYKTH